VYARNAVRNVQASLILYPRIQGKRRSPKWKDQIWTIPRLSPFSIADSGIIINLSVLRPLMPSSRRYWTLVSANVLSRNVIIIIRYFVSATCTSASIGRRNRLRTHVDGISFDLVLSTSRLQKFSPPLALGFGLMCTFVSHRALSCSVSFVLFLSFSFSLSLYLCLCLAHVSCRMRVRELERQDRLATLACN